MKNISLIVIGCFLFIFCTGMGGCRRVQMPEQSTQSVNNSGLRDPSNLADVQARNIPHKEEFLVPVFDHDLIKGLDRHPNRPIVNHGNGWWYFPYVGAELILAFDWFEARQTNLIFVDELENYASVKTQYEELPTLHFEYDRNKGRFIKFIPKALPQ